MTIIESLPSTIIHQLLEASVQIDLAHHVMQHVEALRLDELGYLPKKIS